MNRKTTLKKYSASDKGIAVYKKYRASDKGVAVQKKYQRSDKGMAVHKKYRTSDKGIAARKKYRSLTRVIEARRVSAAAYRKSEGGAESRKSYGDAYRKSAGNSARRRKERKARKGKFNTIFNEYKGNAKARGHFFILTREQFRQFWGKSCSYCGGGIPTLGIDRVDSSLGYHIDNVVSCCAVCNRMKLAHDKPFFLFHCRKIVEFNRRGSVRGAA